MRAGFLRHCAGGLLAACVGFASLASAQAQSAEEFFKGKTLRFTVVYEPGGTYDLYSRLLITHLSKHIAGNPTIVIQYMPGAGGMVGTVNLYEKAARDGTQLGMLPRDIAVNQMLHPDAARYDAKRFNWIGRVASYTGVMLVMSKSFATSGWRVAMLLSVIIVIPALFARYKLADSPLFDRLKQQDQLAALPSLTVLKEHRRGIILVDAL